MTNNIVPLVTDAEAATIRRVCERFGEGPLTVAELLIWTDSVKRGEGTAADRDLLALFMQERLVAILDESEDDDCRGRLRFVNVELQREVR